MFNTQNYFSEIKNVIEKLNLLQIDNAANLILKVAQNNKQIFTCGNGGSAYAASHYVTDWNKMYTLKTGKSFRSISLCDNIGTITAYGNDIDFNSIFSGQIKSLGYPGDLLIVISGSGNSENTIKALETAKKLSIHTLAFVGYDGGKCARIANDIVHIPTFDMQLCEDIHLMIGHVIMKKICGYEIIKKDQNSKLT